MNKRFIVLLSVVIGICTLLLIAVQVKWIQATAKAEKDTFFRNVYLVLEQVVTDIDKQETLSLSKEGLTSRAFQIHESTFHLPAEKRISPRQIDSLLQKEFKRKNIHVPFEYAVTDDLGSILAESNGFSDASSEHTISINFFPNDSEDAPNYYLNVYLPQYNSYIIRSLSWMIIVSVVLTLIIVATFTATLTIISRQKRLSEIKSDFVNNITHELKTPIATISLAAQMIQDPFVTDWEKSVPRLSKMISNESKRLLHMVEKVLQSAIFERGKLKLSIRKIDMHQLIRQVLSQFAIQFDTLQVTVVCRLNAANPMVTGDEIHLANVLSNLMDNAIKYRKENDPLKILIQTENSSGHFILSITDNGIGIDSRDAKHLFEQFYRNSSENVHNVKGFGLGLYYVKNIIETHNGKLLTSGKAGEGSSFGFTLPLYKEK